LSLGCFAGLWTHADQHLFFRHSDHLNARVLSYLRSLDRASTHRDGERHDSQTSHFSGSPDPGPSNRNRRWGARAGERKPRDRFLTVAESAQEPDRYGDESGANPKNGCTGAQAGNEDPNTKAGDSERDRIGSRFLHARSNRKTRDRYCL